MSLVKMLNLEGLEVNRDEDDINSYIVEDVDGHSCVLEIDGDFVLIYHETGLIEKIHKNQDNLIMYSILSALDYEFEWLKVRIL